MPLYVKVTAIAVAAAAYLVCPFDFDFVPVVGWIDDAGVVAFAAKTIRDMVKNHKQIINTTAVSPTTK